MKTFQYSVGGQSISITLDEGRATISEFSVDGAPYAPSEQEMPAYAAAIALALIEHEVETVHDDEPGIITVVRRQSEWSNPTALMNNL